MDYRQFFHVLKTLKNKTKKSYAFILFDVFICAIKYEAGYMDYLVFELYKYNDLERSTFVTRGISNKIVKRYNDMNFSYMLENKIIFNYIFADYLGREWIDLRKSSLDDFEEYIQGKSELFLKPVDQICGEGIKKVKVDDYQNAEELLKFIKDNDIHLVEDVAIQNETIKALNPSSINTVRLVTINNDGVVDVIFGTLRMGDGKYVDNLNMGGLAAVINPKTGIVKSKATTKMGNLFDKHPTTNIEILGLEIPNYDKCIELVKKAASMIPEIGYIGWDVYVTEDGAALIEANHFPGHDLYQLPGQIENNTGLLPHFKEYINFL